MTTLDLVVRAPRVVTSAGEMACAVGVSAGRIVAIEPVDAGMNGAHVVDLDDDETLLPGLVDTHVHVNEPGRTRWEGFASATRAAGAGGVTTIIDMPLNSVPPTTDVQALELKRKTAAGKTFIDVGFWGGAVPGNRTDLRELHDAGVFGFKCFLVDSGVDEFPPLDRQELEQAMRELQSLGALLIVHAEDPGVIAQAKPTSGSRYADFLASRPGAAENLAVARLIELARETGCRAHVLHLSSAEALPMIAAAKRDGVPITVETCPHYLTFTAEEIPSGATQFKCCPPIRDASNRELLWRGLGDGVIDCVVSDHSPCTPDLKSSNDFSVAWGGIASLQVGLPAVWTQARERGYGLTDVVRWMAEAPADLAGLHDRGRIAVGAEASFCVFAPDERFTVDAGQLHHRNPVCAYDGRSLLGAVRSTWLHGRQVDLTEPRGRLLQRRPL